MTGYFFKPLCGFKAASSTIRKKVLHLVRFFHLPGLILLGMTVGCQNNTDAPFSKSAQQALSTFELEPGFKIELIAAEPLISDPVDMEIDENGNMYVVELKGNPFDKSGTGKVKLLTDTDGNGIMDKSTVFADSLIFPSGIMRWKKGLLVTNPPDVLYFEDTDGDGHADLKNVVLTGFDSSDVESDVNNPVFGLDNWIYLGNGGNRKTDIKYPDDSSAPRLPENARGRMVRFRPEKRELEMLSSRTQYGHSFDAWGNHLLVNNSNHLYEEVIAARYLNRNPDLLVSNATETLSDHAAEVFPITKNPENQLLTDIGVFTAACGVTAYLGGAFPSSFNNNVVFVAEPAHNLVHVDRLTPNGATFKASRLQPTKEFLTSTDPWFRPVNMYIGPDGALYVVDYYRQFIEGPAFMAEDVLKTANLYNGTDRGRIYRITKTGANAASWTTDLHLKDAANKDLVEKLADGNIWWRQNAQRLLIDRGGEGVIPDLVHMAQNRNSALGRLHALWTLEGLEQLAPAVIKEALSDPEPGIRENAIRLAELHLDSSPDLASALLAMSADTNAKVRYQLLCTLGYLGSLQANQARQQILFKDMHDRWIQTAFLTADSSDNSRLLETVIKKFNPAIPAYSSFLQRLSSSIASSHSAQIISELIRKSTAELQGYHTWQPSVLDGIAEGLKNRKQLHVELNKEYDLLIPAILRHSSISVRESALKMLRVIGVSALPQRQAILSEARKISADPNLPERARAIAIDFLSLYNPKTHTPLFTALINPREPLPVQLAAVRALSMIPDLTVTHYVLNKWETLTPEIRDAALNTFMTNADRVSLLLNAVEKGKIQPVAIGWPRSVTLMAARWPKPDGFTSKDSILRTKARALLTKKEGKREDVIKQYQDVMKLKGDQSKGKTLFIQHCGICHQVRGQVGVPFGPDLGTVRNWPPGDIMSNILDPNQSIAVGYDLWDVVLKNGESIQGLITSETPTALTLRYANGQTSNIARKDIKSLSAIGMSAMPGDFEKKVNKQQMADILAFLRGR